MTIEKLKALEPIFGTWYVDSKLAEGRSSKVFKVYKTVDGVTEFLALKTVKFPANEKELSRVIESGRYKTVGEYLDTLETAVTDNMNKMLSLRTNKNIVRFDNFQIVKESSCFYVVMLMELLSPFSESVKAESVTPEKAAEIGCDLCSAAEGFRKLGILHHQIKPENVYVDSEGNFKLGDFGISNIADRVRAEASPYMAPEVYNESAYDTSSDIYSIGVLLYKLLNNNRLPFLPEYPKPVSLNDREVAFEKQMRGEKISPPAKADSEMARIISKALAFRQSDRYFSPTLMKAELDRYTEMLSAPQADAPAYPPVFQAPVYVPVTPAVPLSGFQIADEEQEEEKLSVYLDPDTAVSEAEKVAFRKAFKEDSATDEDTDDGKDNKKMYLLVAAIIAVIALIIGVIFIGGRSDSSKNTTGQSVILPTVTTTQPPTVATTPPPTVITTTEPSTTESTTETTTEVTTKSTTETTAATTTEPTTTEAPSTQHTEVPELVASDYSDGDIADDGRTYREIGDYTFIQTPEDEFFDEVILEISTPFGENAATQGNVFIYEMAGSSVIQKMTANFEITVSEEDGEPLICCYITVDDGDFYYSPEYYQYYICFDEGAIVSDSAISLPLQLQL
ncbi:MAG: protein kinase [Clostridia bacterium]|nr:protein kinase [Clostridia bacterium]